MFRSTLSKKRGITNKYSFLTFKVLLQMRSEKLFMGICYINFHQMFIDNDTLYRRE